MEKKQFRQLNDKLDQIIRLLAQNLVIDMKTQTDKIILLYSIGYKPALIAQMLGTTANTVSVAVTGAKKKGRL